MARTFDVAARRGTAGRWLRAAAGREMSAAGPCRRSVGWMGFNPKEPDAPGSLAAVGSMAPGIEVWDLDVVDAVDPVVVLGGVDEERSAEEKKKRKKKGKKATLVFQPGSHEDAVMSLSWNSHVRNVLVSGSADATVKVGSRQCRDSAAPPKVAVGVM